MPDIQALLDGLRDAYATWGYPIVFLGAMLENTVLLGFVLPGGTLVMLGAIYAQQGSLELPVVLLLAWLGMAVGTSLDYALGRFGLQWALRGGRCAARLEPHLSEAERYLQRRGMWAFLLAHFIGHVRSFVAITAGVTRLPLRRFLLYEGIAALTWNLIFVGAGYLVGENVERVQQLMSRAGLGVALVAVVTYAIYRIARRAHRTGHRIPRTAAPGEE